MHPGRISALGLDSTSAARSQSVQKRPRADILSAWLIIDLLHDFVLKNSCGN